MVVPQSGFSAFMNYKQKKEYDEVRVPGDMSYDYLRREIILGTMSVNTIVKIGYNDYHINWSPLIYECINQIENKDKHVDVDLEEEFEGYEDFEDDFDDFEDEMLMMSSATPVAPISNMSISVNIAGNSASAVSISGNSTSLVTAGPSTSQISAVASASQTLGGLFSNLDAQQDNDLMGDMWGYKSFTVLHIAMLLNDDDFIEYLLANKVDVMNSTNDCAPIIFLAIVMKKMDYIKRFLDAGFLLDHRANAPELFSYGSQTVLEVAVSFKDYKMVEFLLSQGASINNNNPMAISSPLQVAARTGDIKMMKFLMEHGAIADEKILKEVCKSGFHLKAVKFLLSNPAVKLTPEEPKNPKVNFPEGFPGGFAGSFYYARHSILFYPTMYGFKELLICLLDAGADVNVTGQDGKMFYEAPGLSNKRCVEVIKEHVVKLLAIGIEVCARNKENVSGGEYDVFLAKCQNEVEVMKRVPVSKTDLTCYDLLKKSEEELTVCLKPFDNCVVSEKAFKKSFPIYGGMISIRLTRCTIKSN